MLLNRKNKINFDLMQEYGGKKLNVSSANSYRLSSRVGGRLSYRE